MYVYTKIESPDYIAAVRGFRFTRSRLLGSKGISHSFSLSLSLPLSFSPSLPLTHSLLMHGNEPPPPRPVRNYNLIYYCSQNPLPPAPAYDRCSSALPLVLHFLPPPPLVLGFTPARCREELDRRGGSRIRRLNNVCPAACPHGLIMVGAKKIF